MSKISQVAVFAASSNKVASKYFDITRTLGKIMATNNIKVVYGGGGTGLMGCLADSVLLHGGYIKGIIPKFMIEVEWEHKALSDLEIVANMHERKCNFLRNTDAIISLPGGCGTLEELLEVITLKRLNIFKGPIVLINSQGFYDPLLEMLEKCVEERFMAEIHRDIWTAIDDPLDVIEAMEQSSNWEKYSIAQAGV